jgi:hypothetical protein
MYEPSHIFLDIAELDRLPHVFARLPKNRALACLDSSTGCAARITTDLIVFYAYQADSVDVAPQSISYELDPLFFEILRKLESD